MNTLDSQQIQFIQNNINGNTTELALRGVPIFILDQIRSRQKAKNKLPSFYNNQDLIFPKPISIEQSSSEKTAIYKASIVSGNYGVDLTGGFGVDSLYLSNSFKKFKYNELDKELYDVAVYNFQKLNSKIITSNLEAEKLLEQETADLIYIDPSRRKNNNRVFLLEDCSPNLLNIYNTLKERSTQILIKLSPMVDIKELYRHFGNEIEIHCLQYQKEVKELLVLTNKKQKLVAANLDKDYKREFDASEIDPEIKQSGKFVFLPDKLFSKLGVSNLIANEINYYQPGKNINLFFGDNLNYDPDLGRFFKILDKQKANKSSLKKYLQGKNYSIVTRNYPEGSELIKNKYKVGESDKFFAFLIRAGIEKQLIIAERI